MQRIKYISYIIPCYNEELTINACYESLSHVANDFPQVEFEFIFVNDASSDGTPFILNRLSESDGRVKVIHFACNKGHQIAVTAGLDFASGDVTLIMDADLQDPPELLTQILEKIREGYDIVHMQRRYRSGESWFKLSTAHFFYKIINWFSGEQIVENCGDFRAISKPVLNTIKRFREPHRFLRGLFTRVGYRQCILQYDRKERFAGRSKYTLYKMVSLAINGFLSMSAVPLRIITVSSMFFWGVSILVLIKAVVEYFMDKTVAGWTSLVFLMTFYSGIITISLAIIGLYVGRIFEQGQHRPLYLIADVRNIDRLEKELQKGLSSSSDFWVGIYGNIKEMN
ncbi:MAG: glycosyltransferase [Desulforudis sp.]|jgi:dolichol-phosphate mannosyltransferase|nr:MAG: glycosyltransferase [Desulforudis sp.]